MFDLRVFERTVKALQLSELRTRSVRMSRPFAPGAVVLPGKGDEVYNEIRSVGAADSCFYGFTDPFDAVESPRTT